MLIWSPIYITCRLKLGMCITTIPTIGFNVETVTHRGVGFTFWDVGGGDKIRPLKKHYYQNSGAIVVIVDSTDRERFREVREELMETKDLGLAHLLVLANKADLDGALGPGELWDELRLGELASEQNRSKVTVLPICATSCSNKRF